MTSGWVAPFYTGCSSNHFVIYIRNLVHWTCSDTERVLTLNVLCICTWFCAGLGGSVGCAPDWWSVGCGFVPRRIGNILSWRLIVKYFLWLSSSFRWLKKGSCQFLAKNVHKTPLRGLILPSKSVVRRTDSARHDPISVFCFQMCLYITSRKHAYIILTLLNPIFI